MSDLLSHPSFVRFWCARVAAVAGMQMLMLMLTIGWHMYELTASAWDLGLVGLFQFLPALAVTLPAGHAADRHHRARIVAVCLSVQAVVAVLLVAGTLAHAVSLDLFAVLLGGATALLPIFAKDILHVGPEGLGVLRSAPAVGALAAGLVLSHVALERRVGRKLLVAVAIFGLCMVVFGLSTSFWLSLLALAVSGAADMVSVVVRQTLVQLETPDQMRGRVAAVNTLFIGASNQLGEFESGVTAAAFGPVGSVVLGGLATVGISLAWWRLFRPLAERDAMSGPHRSA